MTSSRITSKASKAKNRKWNAVERFSTGHDFKCKSFLPEQIEINKKNNYIRRGGAVRSDYLNLSFEDKLKYDAQYLLDIGRVDNITQAYIMAEEALRKTNVWK